jgi:Protein of unknown function (DUF1638)
MVNTLLMKPLHLAPADSFETRNGNARVLLIACGALAREIVDVTERNKWQAFDIQCLPAKWHNTPQYIVPAMREKILAAKLRYEKVFVLYGDCGTGGQLDALLIEQGIERLDGPHCYAFFSGNAAFAATAEADMTSFFLTDYLARHFDKLIWEGLGLHKHPDLLSMYFGNYTKIIHLAQTADVDLEAKAKAAAEKLGLAFEYRFTGYGELETEMAKLV